MMHAYKTRETAPFTKPRFLYKCNTYMYFSVLIYQYTAIRVSKMPLIFKLANCLRGI
jgi:hypothetical protein